MSDAQSLEQQVMAHDQRVQASGLSIWVGAEPTFTDRSSEAAEWLCEALGADKERRARRLLSRLRDSVPGAVVLRSLGRQYAGEPRPRWSYGLYARRDAVPVWQGPPDELDEEARAMAAPGALAALERALLEGLRECGWKAAAAAPSAGEGNLRRLVFRCDGWEPETDPVREPLLLRSSIHEQRTSAAGLRDALAEKGLYLIVLSEADGAVGASHVTLELPALASVAPFLQLLGAIAGAARRALLPSLSMCGFPPPVDASVMYTTLTPDPAVLEVNQAPAADVHSFLRQNRHLFALAESVGLSPCRLHYNGFVTDSGGGGQLTLGGPSAEQSPFFAAPLLLPRLVRYLLRHPALSYWFATRYLGGGSQSPRPDEGLPEAFRELGVALEQLERLGSPEPALLWSTLHHFLADCSGNLHRCELNVEKLHNPYLPGRGCLGLVEFRALRMQTSPERLTAIALLLRSLASMLSSSDRVPELTHWGEALHDRFALPSLLREDLREVFRDLDAAGLGLGAATEQGLLRSDERHIGGLELGGVRLDIEQALEFWPLVGDVASQEAGGSRLVDASTERLEVRLSAPGGAPPVGKDWLLLANGYRVPLAELSGSQGKSLLFGIRYRSFAPARGLHPSIRPEARIVLQLSRPSAGLVMRATWHPWRPDGLGYPGLPQDPEEAARRRAERFVVEPLSPAEAAVASEAPAAALTPYCLDLRRV